MGVVLDKTETDALVISTSPVRLPAEIRVEILEILE